MVLPCVDKSTVSDFRVENPPVSCFEFSSCMGDDGAVRCGFADESAASVAIGMQGAFRMGMISIAPTLQLLPVSLPRPAVVPQRARSLADVPAVVTQLSDGFAENAPQRDMQGGCPKAQRDELRASGLLSLSIPRDLGGLGGSWFDTLMVVRRFSRVDSSVAHLFAFHHLMLATVQLYGQPDQWVPWLKHTARQDWFWGNALNPRDRRATCLRFQGGMLISGPKSFCSGAFDSEMLIVSGDAEGELVIAAVPTSRSGITIIQDWDNMGQRQTDSGSVHFERLRVDDSEILNQPGPLSTPRSCLRSLIAQLILVNIYIGIAEGAFEDARRYTLQEARPWHAAGVDRMEDDPYVLAQFGEFHISLEALRALGDRAGRELDEALSLGDGLTTERRGQLALSIASAKVLAARSGLDICNRLFDVTGARSTHAALGLDRHWRNLRTHTLHDPVHYKARELGEWVLKGALPVPGFYS
jgi:alkylation response protein AidB-like acyl-CoA dehydrogenase